ncbi:MAG: hypothetical protein COY02_03275, partial [Parcubacteria group bacterium CG_4_10_14_0_2_um_filter_41_6]
LVRNVTKNSNWLNTVNAEPNDVLVFSIRVSSTGNATVTGIFIKETLPNGIIYQDSFKIDSSASSYDIIKGFNLGDILASQSKTISFEAKVAEASQFSFGTTNLYLTTLGYNANLVTTTVIKVVVTKKAVAGAATEIKTGLTN